MAPKATQIIPNSIEAHSPYSSPPPPPPLPSLMSLKISSMSITRTTAIPVMEYLTTIWRQLLPSPAVTLLLLSGPKYPPLVPH